MEPKGCHQPVDDHSEEEDDQVEDEIDEPVVRHFHPIDLHRLEELGFFFEDEIVDEHRQSDGKAAREDSESYDVDDALYFHI